MADILLIALEDIETLGVHEELAGEEVPCKDNDGHYQFGNKIVYTHYLREEPNTQFQEYQSDAADKEHHGYLTCTRFGFATKDKELGNGIVGERAKNETYDSGYQIRNADNVRCQEITTVVHGKSPHRHKAVAEPLEPYIVGVLTEKNVNESAWLHGRNGEWLHIGSRW